MSSSKWLPYGMNLTIAELHEAHDEAGIKINPRLASILDDIQDKFDPEMRTPFDIEDDIIYEMSDLIVASGIDRHSHQIWDFVHQANRMASM